jgi:prevent-host-death family protein
MYAGSGRRSVDAGTKVATVISRRTHLLPIAEAHLKHRVCDVNLVSMTRIARGRKLPKLQSISGRPGHWLLQDAKARFSELVRKVRSDGPQHVTVHGRDEVVVIAAEDFRRLKGDSTGRGLIDALQSSPHRKVEIAPERFAMPVRGVAL